MAIVRATALLALLAGCGDDDETTPGGDAGADGGMDGGTDAGRADGGMDASAGDASTDASVSDASTALADALRTDGVRADDARAALVIPAFCTTAVRCNINDAGVTQGLCEASYGALWQDAKEGGDSPACLDAQLDFVSCVATTACAQLLNCGVFRQAQEARCVPDAG